MLTLDNVRIGRKLSVVLGCTVSLMGLVAGAGLYATRSLYVTSQAVQKQSRMVALSERMASDMACIETQLVKLLYNTKDGLDPNERIQALRKDYIAILEEFRAGTDSDEGKKALQRTLDTVAVRRTMYSKVQALIKSGKIEEARKLYAGTNGALTKALDGASTDLKEFRSELSNRVIVAAEIFASKVQSALIGLSLTAIALALLSGTLLSRSISKPLKLAVLRLGDVAEGDVSHDLPSAQLTRSDEMGDLARAIQKLCENWREVLKQITGSIAILSSASAKLSSGSSTLSQGSREASEKAHSVAAASEEMTANVGSVASDMEEASTNLANVAFATEQMTATIGEIAGNSERACRVTEEATCQTKQINDHMNQLSTVANDIGKITETITGISSQTNLLALNATIEAARAGSAGKGFAVVANEIKELAKQTALATKDIKSRIAGVQTSMALGISGIDKVSHVIHEVTGIVSSIAAAIEEQSTATKDIARNIGEASRGVRDANLRVAESSRATAEIASEIVIVDQVAGQMAQGSGQLTGSAADLARVAQQLQATVERFKVTC